MGRLRRIGWAPEGPIGCCRHTVAAAVAARGRAAVPGWQIHVWPGLFIEALFHVVWANPAGHLVDLTAKYPTDARQHSVFATDLTLGLCADPASRYFVLHPAPEVDVLIAAAHQQAENRRAIARRVRGTATSAAMVSADDQAVSEQDEFAVDAAIQACRRLARASAVCTGYTPERPQYGKLVDILRPLHRRVSAEAPSTRQRTSRSSGLGADAADRDRLRNPCRCASARASGDAGRADRDRRLPRRENVQGPPDAELTGGGCVTIP